MKMRLIASVLMSVLIGLGVNTYGEDLTGLNDVPAQVIEIEKSGAVAILQKQPTNEKQTQVIRVKKAGGFLLIQINGKIKDYNTGLLDK